MPFTFKVKKRCRFCGTVLREDGTCPKQTCPRYVPDKLLSERQAVRDELNKLQAELETK